LARTAQPSSRAAAGRNGGGPPHFAPDSLIRRVNGERALALAGPRALLMQAAHPLAVMGLLAHSNALDDPYERLTRTAEAMSEITFGSRAQAEHVGRMVRAMHRRVRGRLRESVGPYPAGTPYRADDPELLMWVLYTLVDSGLVVYEKYVGRLDEDERAAYWSDYRRVGRLFGLRSSDMPRSLDELRGYGRDMIEGDALHVGAWAQSRAREIVFEPPVPLALRPLVETVNFTTVALLPDPIRRQYDFSPLPPLLVRRALVAAGAEYVKRVVVPLLPGQLRYLPHARAT
jgi:uncharacterized protein (DUF2236 family)